MPDLTTLISYLSPNSVSDVATGSKGTSPTKLEVSLVAGAAGFSGKLDAGAYYLARSVYYGEKTDEGRALAAGMELVKEIFRKNDDWSPRKALKSQVDRILSLEPDLEEQFVWRVAVATFQLNMVELGLNELRKNQNCRNCNGAGVVRYKSQTGFRTCTSCNGSGKARMPTKEKYSFLGISWRQWETWGPRYDLIYMELSLWLDQYNRVLREQLNDDE